jgi:hypothetical protein
MPAHHKKHAIHRSVELLFKGFWFTNREPVEVFLSGAGRLRVLQRSIVRAQC